MLIDMYYQLWRWTRYDVGTISDKLLIVPLNDYFSIGGNLRGVRTDFVAGHLEYQVHNELATLIHYS